ncbi:hypothetical protein PVAP13_6KG199712 [Panicum virgatum]|jgi:hypothetical protein|uniref:Uncharacterized protein n=1 Tax=Panicum virgatum TaxID=38727 RepID=A0A8T0RE63_PANVG|nr:hypothetical protein PVAP13_6KG199712 [Panicum virgatum]
MHPCEKGEQRLAPRADGRRAPRHGGAPAKRAGKGSPPGPTIAAEKCRRLATARESDRSPARSLSPWRRRPPRPLPSDGNGGALGSQICEVGPMPPSGKGETQIGGPIHRRPPPWNRRGPFLLRHHGKRRRPRRRRHPRRVNCWICWFCY